ncbi:hypothetical protein [Thermophilibacter sp.]
MDVKRAARIPRRGGWRALGRGNDPSRGRSGAGSSSPRVAVDDFSRVAYAKLLPDERKGTCSAFMARCLAFFADLGVAVERVMTDDGRATAAASSTHSWRPRGSGISTPGRTAPGRMARSNA